MAAAAERSTGDMERGTPVSENTRDESTNSEDNLDDDDRLDETTFYEVPADNSESQTTLKDCLPESVPTPRWFEEEQEAAGAETERDSVFSHAIQSPFHLQSRYLPYGLERPSSLSGSAQSNPQRQENLYIVFDMRKSQNNFLRGQEKTLPVDSATAASSLSIDRDLIYPSAAKLQGLGMLVLASGRMEKYLIVKTEVDVYCLRISQTMTTEEAWEDIRAIVKLDRKQPHASGLHRDQHWLEDELCVFSEQSLLEPHEVLDLPNMSEIKVHQVRPFTWIVNYRWKQYCDKRYILKCRNVDSLDEVKRKFLTLLASVEETYHEVTINEVWFTSSEKVLTEDLRREKCGMNKFRRVFNSRFLPDISIHRTMHIPTPTSLEVFAHFQPADAVMVEVKCKPEAIRAPNEDMVLLVSPSTISPQELRLEVSKLVRQDLHSTRIYVGKKKVEDKTDLSKALRGRNCVITVEQKPKITLTIQIIHKPERSASETSFALDIYSYDTVCKVRDEVCVKIHVPRHRLDLYFEDKLLHDDTTLNQNRLRSKDTILAVVLSNRILLRVRSTGRRWHNLAVDDCFRSTVADVQMFIHGLEDAQGKHYEGKVVAIFKDAVLDDSATLGDVGICPSSPNSSLIFVKMENLCFTASSSCGGKFAVLRQTEDGAFQYVLAMSDGETLFFATPEESKITRKVQNLLRERSKMTLQTHQVTGIRECSASVKEYVHAGNGSMAGGPPARTLSCHVMSPPTPKEDSSVAAWPRSKTPTGPEARFCEVSPCSGRGRRSTRTKPRPSSVRFLPDEPDSGTDPNYLRHGESSTDSSPMKQITLASTVGGSQNFIACRSQSVSARGQAASPMAEPRSKSCPPLSPRRKSVISRKRVACGDDEVKSDSECGFRKDVTFTTFSRNANGNMTLRQTRQSESEITVPECMAEAALGALYDIAKPALDRPETAQALVPYQPLQDIWMIGDQTFRYIKECIILQIARLIGNEGTMLVRKLGVTQDVIERAEGKHPTDIVERHLFCLRSWCRREGPKANKQMLKTALKSCDRNDLVELVDEIDSQTET